MDWKKSLKEVFYPTRFKIKLFLIVIVFPILGLIYSTFIRDESILSFIIVISLYSPFYFILYVFGSPVTFLAEYLNYSSTIVEITPIIDFLLGLYLIISIIVWIYDKHKKK